MIKCQKEEERIASEVIKEGGVFYNSDGKGYHQYIVYVIDISDNNELYKIYLGRTPTICNYMKKNWSFVQENKF